ncbi:MAG: FeoB-associated Cys-rich membrane protein [Clostridia bacterium]|nr:FeoB-associated Cys-rich membrane protein [Clostridia bacterium]
MEDLIVVGVLLLIIGGVVFYLYRAKKRGETCIGCPYAKQCGGKCNGNTPPSKEQ